MSATCTCFLIITWTDLQLTGSIQLIIIVNKTNVLILFSLDFTVIYIHTCFTWLLKHSAIMGTNVMCCMCNLCHDRTTSIVTYCTEEYQSMQIEKVERNCTSGSDSFPSWGCLYLNLTVQ